MTQRPIVTLIVERIEVPVGFRTKGPNNRLIIVEGIGDMVLRNGKRIVCLKMRRSDDAGLEMQLMRPILTILPGTFLPQCRGSKLGTDRSPAAAAVTASLTAAGLPAAECPASMIFRSDKVKLSCLITAMAVAVM